MWLYQVVFLALLDALVDVEQVDFRLSLVDFIFAAVSFFNVSSMLLNHQKVCFTNLSFSQTLTF